MEQPSLTAALYTIIGKKTVEIEVLVNTVKALQKELKELKEDGDRPD